MGKRNSKGDSKKNKSKKHREKNSKVNISQNKEENPEQLKYEGIFETTSQDNVEDGNEIQNDSSISKTSVDPGSETPSPPPTTTDINDSCEEIKAKQEELINKLGNLSASLASIALIRDNVNSIRVDTLTELYFTRQVRPLLDALNILSFSVSNMTTSAVNIQANAFGDKKEIKHALNLSYKMNGEVEDIINSFERRLKIFLKQIDCMDKNCPPFNSRKDS